MVQRINFYDQIFLQLNIKVCSYAALAYMQNNALQKRFAYNWVALYYVQPFTYAGNLILYESLLAEIFVNHPLVCRKIYHRIESAKVLYFRGGC